MASSKMVALGVALGLADHTSWQSRIAIASSRTIKIHRLGTTFGLALLCCTKKVRMYKVFLARETSNLLIAVRSYLG